MYRRESPFDKRTLRQRCTSHVRAQIISGTMSPGDHLIEVKLAQELGVSRGTLREALRPLEAEGLLVDDGRGHMCVRKMNASEILEVFQVRAALETLAAIILTSRPDHRDIAAQLDESLSPLRDEAVTFAGQIEADLGFHELLCELTGNAILIKAWRQLIGQIEMMIIAAGPDLASDRMRVTEHATITDAVRSGDSETASNAVQQHMNDFAEKYIGDQPLPQPVALTLTG